MHPMVWKASGHVDGFSDPLVDCKKCRNRFRQDTAIVEGKVTCPSCGSTDVTEPRNFNLMFKTFMGPVEEDANVVYLRPETAQGIFVNFENVATSMRKKIPFGIAQIGKSFRNEITPGNFTFRTREFEQMEMQYFVEPGTDAEWFEKWRDERRAFFTRVGIRDSKLRFKPHEKLAHYAKAAVDVEYEFPFGWNEIEGIHNRSDFDLTQHAKFSGKKLEYFDEPNKKRYVPYVIETAVGCDRLALAMLCDVYREEAVGGEGEEGDTRIVMGFRPEFAPVQIAFLPLSKKAPLQEMAMKLRDAMAVDYDADYDDSQSIGKRYRRQDEIGTPLCATVDFESIDDQKVTVRHRDKMTQDRVSVDQLAAYVKDKLANF
jgi:glycyl-tRNA synthetase